MKDAILEHQRIDRSLGVEENARFACPPEMSMTVLRRVIAISCTYAVRPVSSSIGTEICNKNDGSRHFYYFLPPSVTYSRSNLNSTQLHTQSSYRTQSPPTPKYRTLLITHLVSILLQYQPTFTIPSSPTSKKTTFYPHIPHSTNMSFPKPTICGRRARRGARAQQFLAIAPPKLALSALLPRLNGNALALISSLVHKCPEAMFCVVAPVIVGCFLFVSGFQSYGNKKQA